MTVHNLPHVNVTNNKEPNHIFFHIPLDLGGRIKIIKSIGEFHIRGYDTYYKSYVTYTVRCWDDNWNNATSELNICYNRTKQHYQRARHADHR